MGTRTQIVFGYGFRIPDDMYRDDERLREDLWELQTYNKISSPVMVAGSGANNETPYMLVSESVALWQDDPYMEVGFPKAISPTDARMAAWERLLILKAAEFEIYDPEFCWVSLCSYH